MAAPLHHALKSPGGSCALPKPQRLLAACSAAQAKVKAITHPGTKHVPSATPEVLPQPLRPIQNGLARPCFDVTGVRLVGPKGKQNPDPNKAKLGNTLRVLQERLPTLLQSPLPQEILAPNISLQLFPTTHPHLPAVSGRVAYNAALWTSPIAWNRVPIIGNVKLEILAERMTSEPLTFLPRRDGAIPEQLVVRWCEKRKSTNDQPEPGGIARALWRGRGVDPNKAFTGLFIFDFDGDGRILTHTIEQAQEGGNSERGVGAKFVGLTDWLLGGMRNPEDTPLPMFESVNINGVTNEGGRAR
ncbi:Uncharacterized protein TCAP_00834 [Tolypocladium capitatum]|uniref:Chromosome transmission fidelity protein 4 n=1 Tax=Tolypocladium capitatum TaxID=45235 RepID=A0A2K3QP02_9HYPO|nr:Uncharacterized protein TCAP_00834 [Tolypocladium capitatum]